MAATLVLYSHAQHRHFAAEVSLVYHQSVQSLAGGFYSTAQCNAWSRAPRSEKYWQLRLRHSTAWLALDSGDHCIGFVQVERQYGEAGYISCLYVLPSWQRRGIAAQLITTVKLWALQQALPRLSTHASMQSKTVFERQGFRSHHRCYQEKSGQQLTSFLMYCPLVEKLADNKVATST
ncbi:GNAT family N-acetyltransferase [Shewanella yunxiaonensis]|uniref:GNAT family N-acetyltransferase n=1 Tax=Shewanella yunxiaonensis TaxID=2829809 RepID=A0ABX7YPX3_9GAMM|nr:MULTISPECIES: GNAT family N-acetyltransferase [Shewanella]MDF0534826.1 GNAT family N-acetyltransferase [Shewanella sp. A32]QUN04757.1 GNAT family N-acetyltransferase [Shewanella yunxiaonensis]